jgi:hypothetical protein
MADSNKGYMAQKEGRIMKYQILDDNKVITTPLHFEKGTFFLKIITDVLDCEILDMVFLQDLKTLLAYCHSTYSSSKSKIISFNFQTNEITPKVYLNNFNSFNKKGRIMKLSKDNKWLYLAEHGSTPQLSNLRVLT